MGSPHLVSPHATMIKENGHYNGDSTIKCIFPQLQREENIFSIFFLMDTPHLGGYLPTNIKENGHYNRITTIKWVFPTTKEENIFFIFF